MTPCGQTASTIYPSQGKVVIRREVTFDKRVGFERDILEPDAAENMARLLLQAARTARKK